ncbi:MFS transporter [Bacillus timonensis]|uniref:MFS transporter n=1 Tax=Bacillus timonensis TaxID=1033734 RepID=A0A4S3PKL9_9BACI|nr:MFS transporter [Bacillus timonensis]THE09664.1 MFS transporter [Bacillus timonensis]
MKTAVQKNDVVIEGKPQRKLSTKVAIAILVLLAASYVVNAMDRQVFPVVVGAVQSEYGFSLTQSGLLSTIFTLGIGLAGIPTGFLLDKLSRKAVMIIGIVIYSAFTLFTAMAIGFPDMLAYRAITGIGEALQNAALFSAVGTYFSSHRSLAIGSLNFAYGVGGFLGPYLGAKMAVAYGWKMPFFLYAVIGFALAFIIFFIVPKIFTETKELEADTTKSKKLDQSHIPDKLYNRNVLLCATAAVAVGASIYGYVGLYVKYLTSELGFEGPTAGFALSLFGIGALMGLVGGWLGDRFNQRYVIVIAFIGAMITGYLLFNVATTPAQHYLLSFLMGTFGSGILFVNVYSLIQRSVRVEYVGRASGIFISSLYLPSAIAGYIFALLVENVGWGGAAFWELTVFPIIGVIAVLFMQDDKINLSKHQANKASIH